MRTLRRRDGLTQKELGSALGESQQNIVNLENGTVKQPRYLIRLASYFNVTVDQLYSGDIDAPQASVDRQKTIERMLDLDDDKYQLIADMIDLAHSKCD